jgi:DNA-directed RNA polymerase subunit M/transcription elongation factor TFIIS
MKFCPECGNHVEGQKFCSECGFKIEENTVSVTDEVKKQPVEKNIDLPKFEEKFGSVLKKTVRTDKDIIFINNTKIKMADVVRIYTAEPTTFNAGYVYFSHTGKPPKDEAAVNYLGFTYTKKQEDLVNNLIVILSKIDGLEISKAVKGLNNMRNDAVVAQNKAAKERKAEKQKIKCPKCKSTNLQHAGNKKKGFSVGKAVGGAVLTGGIGTLAGFAGKKGKKENWICLDCGKKFAK